MENNKIQVGVDLQAAIVKESIIKLVNESGLPITMAVSLLQDILTIAVQSRDRIIEQQRQEYEAAIQASQEEA